MATSLVKGVIATVRVVRDEAVNAGKLQGDTKVTQAVIQKAAGSPVNAAGEIARTAGKVVDAGKGVISKDLSPVAERLNPTGLAGASSSVPKQDAHPAGFLTRKVSVFGMKLPTWSLLAGVGAIVALGVALLRRR